jgi:AcrR family transcriptional regulator
MISTHPLTKNAREFTVFTMTDQRDNILAHACDLYLAEGIDGFSMRKLARAVGVTAPALYRHFESREHVLADVVREAYREFTAYLYRALEGRTPEERLQRAGQGYLDFALEHPRWYQMVFSAREHVGQMGVGPDTAGEGCSQYPGFPDDIQAQGFAIHQFWVDRLRECVDAGLLAPADPTEVGLTLWAHAHGLIKLYQNGHFEMDEDGFRELYRASGARMFMGIATDAYRNELAGRLMAEAAGAEL